MDSLLDALDDQLIATMKRLEISAGQTIFQQGDVGNSMYIVFEGRLEALVKQANGTVMKVGEIEQGDPVGEIQLMTGGRRTASVAAITDSILLELPASEMRVISRQFPASYKALKKRILQRLRRNQLMTLLPDLLDDFNEAELRDLESRFEWIRLAKNGQLLKQGTDDRAMYILVSGRLRIFHEEPDGAKTTLYEIGRGETIGEMSFFSDQHHAASASAVRDSVLVKLSHDVFYEIVAKHPSFHKHITRGIVRRLQSVARVKKSTDSATNIALIALDPQPAIQGFIKALTRAMGALGATSFVQRNQLERLIQLGEVPPADAVETSYATRIGTWLEDQERKYRYVFMEADPAMNTWTRHIVQQADRIVYIASEGSSPRLRDIERDIAQEVGSTSSLLLLLHPDRSRMPTSTRDWLKDRDVERHLHVRIDTYDDIERVARYLAGRSTGIVFSGGGARGFAHIGAMRALKESRIPIDMVGGTSMGAVIAAHVAMSRTYNDIYQRTRNAFIESKPFRKQIPLFSFYQGKKLDDVTYRILYQDHTIEDLWLPCFFVSSSLTTSSVAVHESGPIWHAIRASSALPGIVTPVAIDEHLHVDGGLLNNLPVDVMRERSPGKVIAIDVTAMHTINNQVTRAPNLLDYIVNRNLGSGKQSDFPSILEVLMRSMLLGSVQKTKQSRKEADLCLCPPVAEYGLLEFGAIDDIIEKGYAYTRAKLSSMPHSQA